MVHLNYYFASTLPKYLWGNTTVLCNIHDLSQVNIGQLVAKIFPLMRTVFY